MKIVVYTLTRDRLEYTERSFASLYMQDIPFGHIVIDNGSVDGTVDWLNWLKLMCQPERAQLYVYPQETNLGISRGSNLALDIIARIHPDVEVIAKFDNDAELVNAGALREMARLVQDAPGELGPAWLLSPKVEGINRQPSRSGAAGLGGHPIGLTAIVGGLFHIARAKPYQEYRYPEDLPRAKGQDDHFCHWWKRRGGQVGYVEDMVVRHIDGTDAQALKYPDYFKRKFEEEAS